MQPDRTILVEPCCGKLSIRLNEDYDAVRRLGDRLVVLVGIHQDGPLGLTQCVMCVESRRRFDVPWSDFWTKTRSGEIASVPEMEAIAAWVLLGNAADPKNIKSLVDITDSVDVDVTYASR